MDPSLVGLGSRVVRGFHVRFSPPGTCMVFGSHLLALAMVLVSYWWLCGSRFLIGISPTWLWFLLSLVSRSSSLSSLSCPLCGSWTVSSCIIRCQTVSWRSLFLVEQCSYRINSCLMFKEIHHLRVASKFVYTVFSFVHRTKPSLDTNRMGVEIQSFFHFIFFE